MRKKVLAYAVVPILGVAVLGLGFASAHGDWSGDWDPATVAERFEARLERASEILGISTDTLKDGWVEGKRLPEIAEEQGISAEELHEKMHAERQLRMQERLAALVSEGVITQAEADQRLAAMQERWETMGDEHPDGDGCGTFRKGFRRGFRLGTHL